MKPSVLQTPRRTPSSASHGGRPKETPPTSKHPKIVPKCLSSDFFAVPEEIPTESLDLVEFSPEASSTVEDRLEKAPISQLLLPTLPKADEHRSQGSVDIAVKEAAEGEEEVVVEVEAEMVRRLREALLEVRKSRDVSRGSKTLLGALVEVAGGDLWEENGRWESLVFWAKVRIKMICFMIVVVALAILAVLTGGGGGRDLSDSLPPT